MPKRTRSQSKAAAERVTADEAAPPVLPPSVDPALNATLMSAVSTQIAQGFKALGTAAGPSTSGTGELPTRRPPPPSDDSSESDITEAGEATYEMCPQRHKKRKMSMNMAYGEVGNGLPQSTVERVCSSDYMPLRCLRRSHILDINVDPTALGDDKNKPAVVPVTEIDEWLDLFMIFSAVRARRFPSAGHQLISYMKHVKTISQRKGSDVAIEYDGQFRLQRLSEGVAWDDFQYDLYEECQSFCAAKRQRIPKPFRSGKRGERVSRICFAFNNGTCSRQHCKYSHVCSRCKRAAHGISTCRVQSKVPFTTKPK